MPGRSRWLVGSSMTIRCGPRAMPSARRSLRTSPGEGCADSSRRPGREPRREKRVMTSPRRSSGRRFASARMRADSSAEISCGTRTRCSAGTLKRGASARRRVDLPRPFGPVRAMRSVGAISRSGWTRTRPGPSGISAAGARRTKLRRETSASSSQNPVANSLRTWNAAREACALAARFARAADCFPAQASLPVSLARLRSALPSWSHLLCLASLVFALVFAAMRSPSSRRSCAAARRRSAACLAASSCARAAVCSRRSCSMPLVTPPGRRVAVGGTRKRHCAQSSSSSSRSWLTRRPVPRKRRSAARRTARAAASRWLVGSSRASSPGARQRAIAIWRRLRSPWESDSQRDSQSSSTPRSTRACHASASEDSKNSAIPAGGASVRWTT